MATVSSDPRRESTQGSVEPDPLSYDRQPTTTGWTGWIYFASALLVIIGVFEAIAGFVAIFNDAYYAVPKRDLVITVDYTAWGWAHLALGVIAIGTGLGLLVGYMWARVLAVIFAVVSAVVNLAFLNASPVWSTMIIAFDILVIWAVTVHGSEMKTNRT